MQHLGETISAYSRFLSEELSKNKQWLDEIVNGRELHQPPDHQSLCKLLESSLSKGPPDAATLALFRRRQLVRVLLRDVLGHATLAEVTEELSTLADVILHVCYKQLRLLLAGKHGDPHSGFSIIALGKLGGQELNYSSDIDLMYVYARNGNTDGEHPISYAEFFRRLSSGITETLSSYTPAGVCYRVDLRLRPDGRNGEICLSLDGAKQYYQSRARDWELQMLIKARVAAGTIEPGRELLESAESRIYATTLDFTSVEAVSLTRERIHERLSSTRRRGEQGIDVKLTRGGIRDIEFLVQCLQRLHGGRERWVRHTGTLLALARLADKQLISPAEYSRLATAYRFLRNLEHRLQFWEDRQTHELPTSAADLDRLASRMPSAELGQSLSREKLLQRVNACLEDVQEIYDRVIHSQQPMYYTSAVPVPVGPVPYSDVPARDYSGSSNLTRFLEQRAPGLAGVVIGRPLRRNAAAFEAFLEKLMSLPEHIAMLDSAPQLVSDLIDLFENSPWISEELVRRPTLLEAVSGRPAEEDCGDASRLRAFFRHEMLRIQAASICDRRPIFDTLAETSDLADSVISHAYRLAMQEVLHAHAPATPAYRPRDQLMVIALGRLGMREFDLGSDADLNFVIPDEDADEIGFWTRVAERMVNLISAYTGEGIIFAVDTRLRPNGREGTLVQTVSACREYLQHRAEAWEGITYMKSRCVAGNAERSTRFLHELQQVDWERYGQSGRSRSDLRNMRLRLEREQGESHPLKAGPGGYYDIDFALMYLRLRNAGIFFRVLNTPERIGIIEQMGHLSREDATFLGKAVTLYRSVDHALRLYSGHAEGRLPHAPQRLEAVSELVRRWSPASQTSADLSTELAEIQQRTREYFRRLFGTS